MKQSIDFNNWKCRASSCYKIMTEPRDKKSKDNGELSETAKKFLYEEYAEFVFGKSRLDFSTKQMSKGIICEQDSIELLSIYDGRIYEKNEIEINTNNYVKGTPDIIVGNIKKADCIEDVKTSWDAKTFLTNIHDGLTDAYMYQVMCYLKLTNCQQGNVSFCLVDTPAELIEEELYKADKRLNVLILPKEVEDEIRNSMTFTDIPLRQRVLKFSVAYDDEIWLKIEEKVKKSREFLQQIHSKLQSNAQI